MAKWFLLPVAISMIASAAMAQRKNVAILVFNGVQIIDYTGPYETFGQAGFNVFTVSADTNTIVTSMRMKVIPSYSFNNAPQADVLVIPGGAIAHDLAKTDPIVKWIQQQYDKTEWVLGVCNGTFVLGACGYLDGKRATTNSGMVDHLRMAGKNIIPVLHERFVQDGKIITTGGLSAGIDGALHIVSKMFSPARAREVANNMEYNWDEKGTYARGRLADLLLSDIMDFNPPLRNKKMIVYEGNETQWKSEFFIRRNESLQEFYRQIIEMTSNSMAAKWLKQKEDKNDKVITAEWSVTDMFKQEWICAVKLSAVPTEGELHVIFDITRKL